MSKVPNISIPHDWTFAKWPSDVFPYEGKKARHLVRQNEDALVKAGALTRIGRTVVILGAGYAKWMASQASRVVEFDVPANRPEHAAKRFGHRSQAATEERS